MSTSFHLSGLVAYPSTPSDLGGTISRALENLHRSNRFPDLSSWEENDIPGKFINSEVMRRIEDGNILIADITN